MLASLPTEGIVPGERLTVTIEHSRPIELSALTESLQALATAHGRYADARGAAINGDAVRLYVREIRPGSIVVELIALAQNQPLFVGDVLTIVGFAKDILVAGLNYFKDARAPEPAILDVKDVRDIRNFVAPVAQDASAQMTIVAEEGSTVIVNSTLGSTEANAVQNRSANWIARHQEPMQGIVEGALFYFYQARDERHAKTGDKGIIEAISRNPVKTMFASDAAKTQMLSEALFRKAYVVNVRVQTIAERPSLYTILDVIDTLDRD